LDNSDRTRWMVKKENSLHLLALITIYIYKCLPLKVGVIKLTILYLLVIGLTETTIVIPLKLRVMHEYLKTHLYCKESHELKNCISRKMNF